MVAIVNRTPKTLGIIPILDAYINHFTEVITNRTKFDLAAYQKEFNIFSHSLISSFSFSLLSSSTTTSVLVSLYNCNITIASACSVVKSYLS